MASKINLEDKENEIYKKVMNFYNEKDFFIKNDEIVSKIKAIFNSLSDLKVTDDFFEKFNQGNIVINFNKIFKRADHENLLKLFKELSLSKNVQGKEYDLLESLFYTISGALIFDRDLNDESFTIDDFLEYLNLEILIRTMVNRQDLPESIFYKLKEYFNIVGVDILSTVQSEETYQQHFINCTKLKSILFFNDSKSISENINIMEVINNIMKFTNTYEENSEIQQYVYHIKYDGTPSKEQEAEVDEAFTEVFDESGLKNSNIFNIMLTSLMNKDVNTFLDSVDAYIQYYEEVEKSKLNEPSKKLSTEDKVILFFSEFFAKFQMTSNYIFPTFIEMLWSYYDKEVFKAFMKKYKIPYNICIKKQFFRTDEANNNIVDNKYYSLFETALYSSRYNIADDLIEIGSEAIFQSFYARVIEDDKVYDYASSPFEDLVLMDEEHVLFLIERNVFTHETIVSDFDNLKKSNMPQSIFLYLINNGFDQAFISLYSKTKENYPDFSLKSISSSIGLLSSYFIALREFEAEDINPLVLSIFKIEDFKLCEHDNDNFQPITFLKDLPTKLVIQTVSFLKEIIDSEKDKILLGLNDDTSSSVIIADVKNTSTVQWFDRVALEKHLIKATKRKEQEREPSNIEYIKTMLSDNNHMRENLLIKDESVFDILLKKLPNFSEVINFYKGQFRLKALTGKIRMQPILLLGDPGIGKTYFAKELSKLLNTGYTFVDMGSLTSSWVLSGINGSWKDAKQGKILESLMKSKTINPIFLMDELDKCNRGNYDPTMALYQMLEEITAKEYTDEFIDFSFDTSGIIYIASANSINNIPEPLLSRFKVFTIKKPEGDYLSSVLQNIYKEIIVNTNFNPILPETIIGRLKNVSLREAKVMMEDAVSKSLLDLSSEEIANTIANKQFIELSEKHFKNPVQKNPMGFQ